MWVGLLVRQGVAACIGCDACLKGAVSRTLTAEESATVTALERDTVSVVIGRFEPIIGEGLTHVLEADRDLRMLGNKVEVGELERVVAQHSPCVAIVSEAIDYVLLMRIKASEMTTAVLVFAREPAPLFGTMLLAAGASCLSQAASGPDVREAVRRAARGKPTCLRTDGKLAERYPGNPRLLTTREKQVLDLVADGLTNPEIAAILHISSGTVRTHVKRIFRKLQVQSRRELRMPAGSRSRS